MVTFGDRPPVGRVSRCRACVAPGEAGRAGGVCSRAALCCEAGETLSSFLSCFKDFIDLRRESMSKRPTVQGAPRPAPSLTP